MLPQCLIGVDIGTSNIKAVAFGLDGAELLIESTPTITHYPGADRAYFEPEEIWDAICRVLRPLCHKLGDLAQPAAIAFTSMGEAAIPLDAQGRHTYPAIAWYDRRTVPQVEWWREAIGAEETAQITGLPLNPIFGITKLLWIRQHQPDAFTRTVRWLNMADYGAYRLSGAQCTDMSLASRMLVLDLKERRWSTRLLNALELPVELLGELAPSGVQVGAVHAEAAAQTGLPQGLPVVSGGHDHICGALALGITEPGDVFDSMGTAEGLFIATEQPVHNAQTMASGVGQGVHTRAGRYYAMSGLYFAGGCIDWVRRLLLAYAPDQSFDKLIELANAVPPGSEGVTFLSHLRMANPPIIDSHSRGAFVGLSSAAGPGHLARAAIEGVAYEYHFAYESIVKTFGLAPGRLIVTGGGSRNRLLLQIKAALVKRPLLLPQINEATCLGAAMLGGIGAGVYASFEDAAAQVQFKTDVIEPDVRLHEIYAERFQEVYLKLYPALREINRTISTRFVESA
ncbi:MAG: FGGY family carbohydrate kinase [Caldilineaceae bacterium]